MICIPKTNKGNFGCLGIEDRTQFFSITEGECSLDNMTEKARVGFNDPTIILVDCGGARIVESDVTRGLLHFLSFLSKFV